MKIAMEPKIARKAMRSPATLSQTAQLNTSFNLQSENQKYGRYQRDLSYQRCYIQPMKSESSSLLDPKKKTSSMLSSRRCQRQDFRRINRTSASIPQSSVEWPHISFISARSLPLPPNFGQISRNFAKDSRSSKNDSNMPDRSAICHIISTNIEERTDVMRFLSIDQAIK